MRFNYDELATTRKRHYFVIPVKTGIQYFQWVPGALDTRFRGYDELLPARQFSHMIKQVVVNTVCRGDSRKKPFSAENYISRLSAQESGSDSRPSSVE
jgi:hypothetical protein